ncbi:hypothetical protein B0H14DRAFT_2682146 [Mycena olivaceomarginata]|nr:hypothetical protein B0H14DRAFT_2682146 [Mycena olivaceomarginata]
MLNFFLLPPLLRDAVGLHPYSSFLSNVVLQVLFAPFLHGADYHLWDVRLVPKGFRVLDDFDTARSRAGAPCHRLGDPAHLHGVRGAVNIEATRA